MERFIYRIILKMGSRLRGNDKKENRNDKKEAGMTKRKTEMTKEKGMTKGKRNDKEPRHPRENSHCHPHEAHHVIPVKTGIHKHNNI